MLASFCKKYVCNRYFLVCIFLLLAFFWFFSGSHADEQMTNKASDRNYARQKVQVQQVINRPVARQIRLSGHIFADRTVVIKSQIAETVATIPANQGASVDKGQLLVQLKNQTYLAELNQAKALVAQRNIQYDAVRKLHRKELSSALQIAESQTNLKQAESYLATAQKNYDATLIQAPFAGILYDLSVEVGDYVTPGSPIVSILDDRRLIAKTDVPQKYVQELALGYAAVINIANRSDSLSGSLHYIAPQADADTRAFALEIAIQPDQNPNHQHLAAYAGSTADISITLPPVQAVKISPALLALNDQGTIGVKLVDEHHKVVFHAVEEVKTDTDGIWISGLEDQAKLIIQGAGIVKPGELVAMMDTQDTVIGEKP